MFTSTRTVRTALIGVAGAALLATGATATASARPAPDTTTAVAAAKKRVSSAESESWGYGKVKWTYIKGHRGTFANIDSYAKDKSCDSKEVYVQLHARTTDGTTYKVNLAQDDWCTNGGDSYNNRTWKIGKNVKWARAVVCKNEWGPNNTCKAGNKQYYPW
ncbi:hypothetical protein QIS99_23730 [Streptomyces sp. B-S-A8]|uniref:Secreted protein n=1 Tax=Streptomyces solicavernae TaxID=3043614 RepID=A0ABT6RYG0_9ACTN|nr:hypothetical protein [Streptomyces sp. B-S-A8]MDI3389184.1 hypothetical protein [Streptomyces sp. B-S-A8]